MRVLFLTSWFPTEDNPHKGIFVLEQAKALKSVGVEVVIIHLRMENDGGLFSRSVSLTEMEGVSLAKVEILGSLWKFVYTIYPLQLFLLKRSLKEINIEVSSFDIVHSHIVHPAGAVGNRLAIEHGIPHYISEHWSNLAYYFDKNLFRKWGIQAYEQAKKVFVVSKFLKSSTARFISDPNRLHVIPNVVSSEDFTFKAKAIGTSYYFVIAAKWSKGKRIIKRPKLVIEAVAQAAKELDKPVILGIIGEGDQVPELKEHCKKHDVEAHFLGTLKKVEVANEFQKADLFLHASEYETFSLVVAEALKCGTPVVASNVAAIPELIDDSCGILVDNNVSDWKDGIVKAINSSYDQEKIAQSFKAKFGYKEVGKMLIDAYSE